MQQQPKRSRARIAVIGALIGGVMSIGAVSGPASAGSKVERTKADKETTITVVFDTPVVTTSFRSGIRW